MDDVNDMDESMDTLEPSAEPITRALGAGIDRRTMLKAAVAAGTFAGAWVAPRIETFGFTPAGAATPCIILSSGSDDKNSPQGGTDCIGTPCCGASFGNNATQNRFTFNSPAPNCTEIVVRLVSLNCVYNNKPDIGQFGLVIESATGAGCGVCKVLEGVLVTASMRVPVQTVNNGPLACPPAGAIGDGIDASFACNNPNIGPSNRLAVRITCTVGNNCT